MSRICASLSRTEEEEQLPNMDDDKLVSDEVHMRQLSATPSSAFSLQQRRQSNSVTHSAPPELTQRHGGGGGEGDTKGEAPEAGTKTDTESEDRVVLRRAVEKGAIALAQIDDLKLEGDDEEEEAAGGGLSNPAAQTTDDEQITATATTVTATTSPVGAATSGVAAATSATASEVS